MPGAAGFRVTRSRKFRQSRTGDRQKSAARRSAPDGTRTSAAAGHAHQSLPLAASSSISFAPLCPPPIHNQPLITHTLDNHTLDSAFHEPRNVATLFRPSRAHKCRRFSHPSNPPPRCVANSNVDTRPREFAFPGANSMLLSRVFMGEDFLRRETGEMQGKSGGAQGVRKIPPPYADYEVWYSPC